MARVGRRKKNGPGASAASGVRCTASGCKGGRVSRDVSKDGVCPACEGTGWQ